MKVEDIKVGMKVKLAKITKCCKALVEAYKNQIGEVTVVNLDPEWGSSVYVLFPDGEEFAFAAEELEEA